MSAPIWSLSPAASLATRKSEEAGRERVGLEPNLAVEVDDPAIGRATALARMLNFLTIVPTEAWTVITTPRSCGRKIAGEAAQRASPGTIVLKNTGRVTVDPPTRRAEIGAPAATRRIDWPKAYLKLELRPREEPTRIDGVFGSVSIPRRSLSSRQGRAHFTPAPLVAGKIRYSADQEFRGLADAVGS